MTFLKRMVDANDNSVDGPAFLTAVAVCGMVALAAYDVIHNGRSFDAESLGIGLGALLGGGGGASLAMGWRQRAVAGGSRQIDNPDP